jgi:hypothetical protein
VAGEPEGAGEGSQGVGVVVDYEEVGQSLL